MSVPRMQFCFNCGEELGVYARNFGDDPECCGATECNRELRIQMACQESEARERAEQDHYERYR